MTAALQRGAERAQRRVELENAVCKIERIYDYEVTPEHYPWVSVLSHVFISECNGGKMIYNCL